MRVTSIPLALVICEFLGILTIGSHVLALCNVKSGTGLTLVRHAYSTFPVQDFQQCYEKCKADEPKCRSFNFHGDHSICDLNNATRTSHPNDSVANPFSVYFQSHYRVSTGSKRSFAGSSCEDILSREVVAEDGFYWLNSSGTEDPYVTFCNMTNGGDSSSSFDLVFAGRNITNYALLPSSVPDLSSFTVCFWFRSLERQLLFLSYAAEPFTDAIMMFLSSSGLFRFLVLNQQTHGHTGIYDDSQWHHVCGSWDNADGHVQLFIDGESKLNSSHPIHGTIPGGGKFILGQDQDIPGGAFDPEQTFVGEMTHVYIWSTALKGSDITAMTRHCKEHPYPGHVIGWADFSMGLEGNTTRRNNSRCVTHKDMLH